MTFAVRKRGDAVVIEAGKELALRTGAELKQCIVDEVERGERKFVLDFSNTEFIDSAGLGTLISISKVIHARDGQLRLMGLNDDMRRLFELTKLDTLFDVVDAPAREPGTAGITASTPSRSASQRTNGLH